MVFLATVLPWSNSVSPSVFIGQVLTSGSFVFSPRGVVRQGLNRVLTPGEARLPQRHSSLSLEILRLRSIHHPDRSSHRFDFVFALEREREREFHRISLSSSSSPRFHSRQARAHNAIARRERDGRERQREKKKRLRGRAADTLLMTRAAAA